MAGFPSEDDRLSVMAAKLEDLTNSSAADYMYRLDFYLRRISLAGQFGNASFLPDTTEGVALVVIIPILYFLVLFIILGLVIGYVWYSHFVNPSDVELSGMASISRTSSRRNKTFTLTEAATTLDDFFRDAEVSRGSIGSVSKMSCASCKSCVIVKINGNEFISTLEPLKNINLSNGACDKPRHSSCSANSVSNPDIAAHSKERLYTPHKINITLSSQSCSTESLPDGLSRDTLRASMESHKLLRMGNSKIKPDDTYSWSDNTAYSTGLSGSQNGRPLRGFQNPVFTSELVHSKSVNILNEFEDPLGFTADRFQNQRRNSEETSVINISTVSADTNYPSSSFLVPHNSESSLFGQPGNTARANTASQAQASVVICEVDNNVSKVGGSLPPLPPNHYHRRNMFSSPSVPRQSSRQIMEHSSSSLLDIAPSDLDKSSLIDTSADSTSLSLPSSIARFHASRVQPLPTPQSKGFLASTLNPTPEQNTEWVLANFFQPEAVRPEDGNSICPNVGSFNQSFECSVPVSSFLEASFDNSVDELTAPEFNDSKECNQPSDFVTPTKSTTHQPPQGATSPVVYREGNARLKRLISLDQLKSGKISVEQRLRQFGYVKSNGRTAIYTEMQTKENSVKAEASWNSLVSSIDGRIENLSHEMKKRLDLGDLLTLCERKMEMRPEIGHVLDANKTPSHSNIFSNHRR